MQACEKAWKRNLADWRADDLESCFTAVKSGHNFATALLLEAQAGAARQVLEQAVGLIEATHGTLPQHIRETQLQLYRDIGRSYLLQNAWSTAHRKENAARARAMLQKEMQLFDEYPFDVVENPDLLCKVPMSSCFEAEAYFYEEDYEKAYLTYLRALKEAEETQAQLGNLSVQRDLPVTFLQMYARIAQKLGKYQNVPETLIKRYRRILEQFEVLHYNAEHQTMAQGYFEDIRTALKSWENGTP